MRICLVEDDLELGRSIQQALEQAGHQVVWVRRATEGREHALTHAFDAMVLDLGLPDGDGLALVASVRRAQQFLPILIITARDSIEDRLAGLDAGSDDYLVKPFAAAELLARLRAVARRSGPWAASEQVSCWQLKDLCIDELRATLSRQGAEIRLSRTELALLLTLVKLPPRVVTRRELAARAMPHADSHSLDVHMFNLRKKIGEGYIRTVRGVGYVIDR